MKDFSFKSFLSLDEPRILYSFLRWVFGALVVFLAVTVFIQGTARTQCEQGKPFIRAWTANLAFETKVIKALIPITREPHAKELRIAQLKNDVLLVKALKPAATVDCAEKFPYFPLVGV